MKHKTIKIITIGTATTSAFLPMVLNTNKPMAFNTKLTNDIHEDVGDVWSRFCDDVETKHETILNDFINKYKTSNRSSTIQPWAAAFWANDTSAGLANNHKASGRWEGIDNWRSKYNLTSMNFETTDNLGIKFDSVDSKPRLLSNQLPNLTPSTFIKSINSVGNFWDSSNDDSGMDVDHHQKAADAWAQDGHLPSFENAGLDNIFQVINNNENINFHFVNLKFKTVDQHFQNRYLHEGSGFWHKSDQAIRSVNDCLYDYATREGVKDYVGNVFHCKSTQYFQSFGEACWFYQLQQNYLNIKILQYGLDNVFGVNDLGYDANNGYYLVLGINKDYLKAAEGEKNNPQTQIWWENELVDGNRILWINPDYVSTEPAWEQQRNIFFSEVQKLINERKVTYDNYTTIRDLTNTYCINNDSVPYDGWLTTQIDSDIGLQNNGWVKLSETYGLTGLTEAWDYLLLILPELNYSIKMDRNSQPEHVESGIWEGWRFQKPSFSWDEVKNDVKQIIGPDANSIAFKTNCDIKSEENTNKPFNIDSWASNINNKGEIIDSNLVKNTQDLNFIYDNTVSINKDPKTEFSDKDTYWKFDKNLKKLCVIENEPNISLHITVEDKKSKLPSEVWNNTTSNIAAKLKTLIADQNNNPASVYGFKTIDGNYNYDLPDNHFKVICHNDTGKIEVRLINPDTNEIVYSTNLVGFKQNESGSQIIYNFQTPLDVGTNKTSPVLNVSLVNEIEGSVIDYISGDETIAEVNKVQDDGRKITIKGLNRGTVTITSNLWDSKDHKYIITSNQFNVNVVQSPTGIELNTPFNQITTGIDSTDKASQNFTATLKPAETSQQVVYELINAPDWLNIDYDGYISWKEAKKGTYSFKVKVSSIVDKSITTTSDNITLYVGVKPNNGADVFKIAMIIVGALLGVGLFVPLTIWIIKRRRK